MSAGAGLVFRVSFDADCRFATEEGGVYVDPSTLASKKMGALADHLRFHRVKQRAAEAAERELDEQGGGAAAGAGGAAAAAAPPKRFSRMYTQFLPGRPDERPSPRRV